MEILFALSIVSVLAPSTAWSRPDWAKQSSLQRQGNFLTVSCEGHGPALDLARRQALDGCRATAADQANGTFSIQTLSIETDQSASFHQEVSREVQVTNLICVPQKEQSEELGGSYQVWLKCQFDLSKAKVLSTNGEASKILPDALSNTMIIDRDKAASIAGPEVHAGTVTHGQDQQIIISTFPSCNDILVRGEEPRTVQCDESPKTVLIKKGDREMIIRSPGFTAKHINLDTRRKPSSGTEVLEVFLERM